MRKTLNSEPLMSAIKSCHAGVLFALATEAGALEDLLSGLVTIRGHQFTAKEGGWKGRRVVVARSGSGRNKAAAAAETLIDGHRPRWLISAGFAGGLAPTLARHDLLLVDQVGSEDGQWTDLQTEDSAKKIPSAAAGVTIGKLLSLDRAVRTPQEKQVLYEKHGAQAADMETFAVAEVCRRRRVPLLGVRIILDAAADTLPPDIDRLLRQPSEAARWGAALGAVWRRPGSFKDLWALKENALIASDKLAKFLAEAIAALPE